MKIFISWSGERSHSLAHALHDWLPGVINAAEPWLSSNDIEPGSRWSADIFQNLENTEFGIVCLTQENLENPWIHFEAGALSKRVINARIVPLLLDVEAVDIQGPLAQFQAVFADKNGIKTLLLAINKAIKDLGEISLTERKLDEAFELWWPTLENVIVTLPPENGKTQRKRTDSEILSELLILTRSLTREQTKFRYSGPLLKDVLDTSLVNTILNVLYERTARSAINLDIRLHLHHRKLLRKSLWSLLVM